MSARISSPPSPRRAGPPSAARASPSARGCLTADLDLLAGEAVVERSAVAELAVGAPAEALLDGAFQSAWFDVPTWNGAEWFPIYPSRVEYTGTLPVVPMVGPRSVSAAENFGGMLEDSGQITFVGRTSAGTNGNITGMPLPGGHHMLFTGMEVTHVDGSQFHGIVIVRDIEVVPTREDWVAGRAPELEAAAAVFGGGVTRR